MGSSSASCCSAGILEHFFGPAIGTNDITTLNINVDPIDTYIHWRIVPCFEGLSWIRFVSFWNKKDITQATFLPMETVSDSTIIRFRNFLKCQTKGKVIMGASWKGIPWAAMTAHSRLSLGLFRGGDWGSRCIFALGAFRRPASLHLRMFVKIESNQVRKISFNSSNRLRRYISIVPLDL